MNCISIALGSVAVCFCFSTTVSGQTGRVAGIETKTVGPTVEQQDKTKWNLRSTKVIKRFDKNGNRKLEGEERALAREFVKRQRAIQLEQRRQDAILKTYDANGDGKLSKEEEAVMTMEIQKLANVFVGFIEIIAKSK